MTGSRARGRGIRRQGSGMAWWLWVDKQSWGKAVARGNVGEVGAEVWCGGQSVAGQWYPGATGTAHGSGRGEAGVFLC